MAPEDQRPCIPPHPPCFTGYSVIRSNANLCGNMQYSGTVSTALIGASLTVRHYCPVLRLCCAEIRAPSTQQSAAAHHVFFHSACCSGTQPACIFCLICIGKKDRKEPLMWVCHCSEATSIKEVKDLKGKRLYTGFLSLFHCKKREKHSSTPRHLQSSGCAAVKCC